MDTKTKALAVLLVALVAGGVLLIVQAQSENAQVPKGIPEGARPLYKQMRANRWWLVRALIAKGEPTELTGTLKAYEKGLMVLQVGSGIKTVLVPGKWVKGDEIMEREALLEGLVGDMITIKALRLEYTGKYKATIYFAYEFVDHATALLPWNIEPATS